MRGSALEAMLLDAASGIDGSALRPVDGGPEVLAGGAVVAVIGAGALEVRLRPAVAAAALRTPDTVGSRRGRGWVRFAPPELDEFARDRALAWLESAVRLAAEDDRSGD